MSTIHYQGREARNSAISIRSIDSENPKYPGNAPKDPNTFIVYTPKERFKLGYISVMSLVANRMIGSGIFVNSGLIYEHLQNPGLIMILWTAGVLYAFAGTIVYIEFGLALPQRTVMEADMPIETAVPRSGGDLNYLQYVYHWPAYAKDTLHFITAVFGIPFIIFGTMAPNALNFGIRVLQVIHPGQDTPVANRATNDINSTHVRLIAFAVTILACMIHIVSRRGGIFLNNIFAGVKVGILLLMIVTTIVYTRGGFKALPQNLSEPYGNIASQQEVIYENLSPKESFKGTLPNPNVLSTAFLDIIFTFSGFEQANYVLGEIGRPRRKFPIGLSISVVSISLLYIIINICFFIVVPGSVLKKDRNITEAFFIITFGSFSKKEPIKLGRRISDTFLAISALGNVIVMTYTATRVKQEIAKEGILPWSKFFAQNYDLSLGRLLLWLRQRRLIRGNLSWIFRSKWLAPNNFQEEMPVGALLLHLATSLVLIFGTWPWGPFNIYKVLTNVAAYLINAFFGMLLAVAILYLRLTPSKNWTLKSPHIPPKLSISAAIISLVLNILTLVLQWTPPPKVPPQEHVTVEPRVHWTVVPSVSVVTLALGVAWWFIFVKLAKRKDRKENTALTVEKVPEYERYADDPKNPGGPGLYVQTHETVHIWRKARDYDKG